MRLCVLLSSSAINRTKSKILKKVKSDDTTDHTICTITARMTSGEKLRERAICLNIDGRVPRKIEFAECVEPRIADARKQFAEGTVIEVGHPRKKNAHNA